MSFAFALVLDPPCRRPPEPRRPASIIAPIFILCSAQIPHKPQQPADHAPTSQPSLPSIASPTPHLLHRCGQIPIVPAAPPSTPHRGFVQWRLSDAGRRSMSHRHQRPASETLNISGCQLLRPPRKNLLQYRTPMLPITDMRQGVAAIEDRPRRSGSGCTLSKQTPCPAAVASEMGQKRTSTAILKFESYQSASLSL